MPRRRKPLRPLLRGFCAERPQARASGLTPRSIGRSERSEARRLVPVGLSLRHEVHGSTAEDAMVRPNFDVLRRVADAWLIPGAAGVEGAAGGEVVGVR